MCFRLKSYRNNSHKEETLTNKKTLLFNVVTLTLIAVTILTVVNFWFFLDEPKVKIGEGHVLGTTIRTRNGRQIFAFLGIPYAEAPLKNLRFRNPVPKRAWRGTLKAQKEGYQCLQFHEGNVVGNENCLTLNIYTPKVKRTNLLPVLVFIHGGGYLTGNSSRHLYGPDYLLDKDILLVTLNYRLGLFGFLSTGDAAAPGNFGLKDQVLALKWVRRNIRAFGGNRNEVLLVGQNAGATCVNLHSISNSSKHLFNRYIMQSEIAIPSTGFRFDRSYFHSAKRLGSNNNCFTNDSYSLVNCLRRSSAIKLMKTSLVFTHLQQLLQMEWGPVVEPQSMGAFLTESPITLVERCELKRNPFMMGFVRDEASSILRSSNLNETAYNFFARDQLSAMEKILQNIYFLRSKNTTYIANEAKKFYLGTEIPKEKEEVLHGISQFLTDVIVLYPSMYYIKYVTEHCGGEIYVCLFNYRGTTNTLFDSKDYSYYDDLIYLFPRNSTSMSLNYHLNQTSSNRNISDLMVDLWTSFAVTSAPSSILLKEPSLWKPYSNNSTILQIGNISDFTTTLQTSFFAERMRFMHSMYYYI
ncbi:esterase E4-like [Halictus rubicundus]|uniref:esterase E4-like n=1 Tax=Halictus rubicundus TaxID=77578 RepID=UPI0040371F38